MSYEITGKICHIGETIAVTEKFRKREFVLEITEEFNGQSHTQYAKMQTVQAKCALLDSVAVGDNVTASFNVKGNKWERDGVANYITNLDCWKLDKTAHQSTDKPAPETRQYEPSPENVDDLPF